jgi:ubiquinone/menaquinone biosynthesis C-methylase UbiE
MPRTPEPEVMDSEQEARDYDAMDHGEVNASFCVDLLALRARPRAALDAGTGTALIAIELCRRAPEVTVDAVDLAEAMLARGARNVERAGMGGRIRLVKKDATATRLPGAAFDTVMSNSLAHHVPEPLDLFTELWRLVRDGGLLFVRDLARPENEARVTDLAQRYAKVPNVDPSSEAGAMHARQRALFVASLHAALTADEVRAMVAPLGIPGTAVRMTSDRHWTLAHVRS